MERVKLGPADVRILQCLQGNARRSMSNIAGLLKMPESTVRHRMNRLVEEKVVEFAAVIDPLRFGFQIWVLLEVKCDLKRIRSVAQRLAKAPEVTFVGIVAGGYDILAAAIFRSNEEFIDFITTRLSRIPGIVSTETSSVVELVKRTTFGLPEETLRVMNNGGAAPRRRSTRGRGAPARAAGE